MRKALKLKLWLLGLLLLLIVPCVPPALATPTDIEVDAMVAFDEEWIETAFWFYGYTPEALAQIIIISVNAHFDSCFGITFVERQFKFWDSYDSPADPYEMADEVVDEVGFLSTTTRDVLIAFTGQEIPMAYGFCNRTLGVVLVGEQYLDGIGQATDNILQHELSHLYQCEHHWQEGLDCLMNIYPVWIWELWDLVPTVLLTNSWCDECINIINTHRTAWGVYTYSGGSGGGGGGWRPIIRERA